MKEYIIKPERKLPFDAVLKPLFLFFHFLGFIVVIGSFYFEKEPDPIYSCMIVGSGILLMLREMYEEGMIWFLKTEGLVTLSKLLFLTVIFLIGKNQFILLVIVVLMGICTCHIPRKIKKKVWFVHALKEDNGKKD